MISEIIKQFYREGEPEKREKLLEYALEHEDDADNALRRELFDIRYQKKKDVYSDRFIAFWMMLNYLGSTEISGSRKVKRAAKVIEKELAQIRYDEWAAQHKELLYQEMLHMVSLWIRLCRTDKTYGKMLFGILNLSEKRLAEKIRADLILAAVTVPERTGMKERLELFTRAALEAYQQEEGTPAEETDFLSEYIKKNQ